MIWARHHAAGMLAGAMLVGTLPAAFAGETQAKATVRVQWIGHAYFVLTDSTGRTVAIDPFHRGDGTLTYKLPEVKADVLLISHEHFDHNHAEAVAGKPAVLRSKRGEGTHTVGGLRVTGTGTYHDNVRGKKRGENTVYSFELEGIRFCHMGDIGHLLTTAQRKSIGRVDVLMVPVGGNYTIDVGKVYRLVEQLGAKVVIPMHYKTKHTGSVRIGGVDKYLAGKKGVRRLDSATTTLEKDKLPEDRQVWVLKTPGT